MTDSYEAVIIGSGFGGAINACRLSKKWPGQVLVIERGKRYGLGGFPRTPHAFANNFWNIEYEKKSPRSVAKIRQRGLFDVRYFGNMDVVLSAGLGGGSLIYANVFLEPPEQVFSERWPSTCRKAILQPYYQICKEVLGARPIPTLQGARRIVRTELFQNVARELRRDSQLVDINVFFGDKIENPLAMGVQAENRYGARQTSCVYCAECDIGCNYHAKNTVDLNYLYQAEQKYQAKVLTEHIVDFIVPVNSRGEDDKTANGVSGYRVYYRDLTDNGAGHACIANRVVVSAGSLGSTELLLRCRDVYGKLPRINGPLGRYFSGNGDFLSFVVGTKDAADPNYGPVITQRTDFNLFSDFDSNRAFILEDASYPNLLAWFAQGAKPGFLWLNSLWRTIRHIVARIGGHTTGSIGFALQDLLSGDLSYHTCVLLCMGVDRSNGLMTLNRHGWLELEWPLDDSRSLYDAIIEEGKHFARTANADAFITLPTWWWPFRKNISVHPLGGCVLGDSPNDGVTSSNLETFGQVYGYRNLYVSDGAIVPNAVGANPSATISALSELVAEGITGIKPTADL